MSAVREPLTAVRQRPGFEFSDGLGARDGFRSLQNAKEDCDFAIPNGKQAQLRTIRPRRRINFNPVLFGGRTLTLPPKCSVGPLA